MQNMADPAPDRTEMWKALKWTMILLVGLLIAVGLFKAYQIATAPARVMSDAAGSVKSGASAVLNRLDIPVAKQRRFDKTANAAFAVLNEMDATPPDGVKARGFRMANFRGAENRVCELSYDFGSGDVPVFIAADNAAHAAAKAIGSDADRLIRIVVLSPEQTLGLNAEFDAEIDHWTLGWRPSSLNKPYPDDWAEGPITNILASVLELCSLVP
jgi:hypothetical protein